MTDRKPDERELRFAILFNQAFTEVINPAEFAADDFYAFKVIERALRSENQELRNLAFHLESERSSSMEVITMRSPDALDATRRMKTITTDGAETGPETAADEQLAKPGTLTRK
jgi:hypothetical protein